MKPEPKSETMTMPENGIAEDLAAQAMAQVEAERAAQARIDVALNKALGLGERATNRYEAAGLDLRHVRQALSYWRRFRRAGNGGPIDAWLTFDRRNRANEDPTGVDRSFSKAFAARVAEYMRATAEDAGIELATNPAKPGQWRVAVAEFSPEVRATTENGPVCFVRISMVGTRTKSRVRPENF